MLAGLANWAGQSWNLIDKNKKMEELYDFYEKMNNPDKMEEMLEDNIFYQQWQEINSDHSI